MTDEFIADPTLAWDDSLSDRHEELSTNLDSTLDNFEAGGSEPPLAVVGPYGAGKTQYLYEVLRRSWSRDIPAVYTDLKSILDGYEGAEISLSNWIDQRVREEVPCIIEREDPDWLPRFTTSEKKNRFYEEFVRQEAANSQKYVLLIDEVEQKYTELDEYVEVDDENKLRNILDGLTDVLQVWSFGLVSAYEILGEADRRRFQEARIPIADVDTVENRLCSNNLPASLANGIWWLARGRAGWIAKHREGVKPVADWTDDAFQVWIGEAADHTYYGADSIARVWDKASAGQILAAKKTILFSEPAYEPWVIDASTVISVDDAHEVILNSIGEQDSIEGEIFEILSDNLRNILESLSPTSNWVRNDSGEVEKMFLPANSFSRDKHMQGLVDTVSDFITSFEKRGEARQDAVRILSEVDIESLTNQWSDLLDPLEKAENYDLSPWTVKPSVVRDAYPPLALNPQELTDKDTSDIRSKTVDPIQFDPEVTLKGGSLRVQLCPTEPAFDSAVDELSTHSDITKATVLLLPDDEDAHDNWAVPNHASRLQEHNLLTIEYVGGSRLWDFILQLHEYKKIREYETVVSPELVEETIIPEEPRDQVRNTISALFADLKRLVKEITRRARSSFLTAFSLEASGGLIWRDSSLADTSPFYSTTSGAKNNLIGLAYCSILSHKSVNEGIDYLNIVDGLLHARNNEYIAQRPFRFTYYLRQTYSSDESGLTERANTTRQKYVTETGDLKPPVLRLQRALAYLSRLQNQGAEELYNLLKNVENSPNEIAILMGTSAEYQQVEGLFWGLLLDWALNESPDLLIEDLQQTETDISKLSGRVDSVEQQVEFINSRIEAPVNIPIEDEVKIRTDRITDHKENINTISQGIGGLRQNVEEFPRLASAVVPLWAATGQYEELMGHTIGELEQVIGGLELYTNINELKSEYNTLRTWMGSTNCLDEVSVNQSELLETTELLGKCIFDFSTRVGKPTISITQHNLLEKLDDLVEEDARQLGRLNSRIKNIEERSEQADNSVSEIIDSLVAFASTTTTQEVDP